MSISSFIQQEVSTWPLSDAGARSLIFSYISYISFRALGFKSQVSRFLFFFSFFFFLNFFLFLFIFVTLGSMKGSNNGLNGVGVKKKGEKSIQDVFVFDSSM